MRWIWAFVLNICFGTNIDRHRPGLLTRFAFGSCRKQWLEQPIWRSILAAEPEVFFWIGDMVYIRGMNASDVQDAMLSSLQNPDYHDFMTNHPQLYIDGVWDDHDYGVNDGDGEVSEKAERQRIFLDHLRLPQSDPRRKREGLYSAHTFGETQLVKVIVLDVRYHRKRHRSTVFPLRNVMPYPLLQAASRLVSVLFAEPAEEDLLGQEQWDWLRAQLTNSKASAHIIISGIQVLGTNPALESWAHFPSELQRLMHLLDELQPRGALLLSGDVHFAELLQLKDGTLIEATSSGLTHACGDYFIIGHLCYYVIRSFSQTSNLMTRHNFGLIDFHWDGDEASFRVSIRGVDGSELMGFNTSSSATPRFTEYYHMHYDRGYLLLALLLAPLPLLLRLR